LYNDKCQNAITWGDNRSDPWNTSHFLDCAELTAAFAIAYDWLYDAWTSTQRDTIRQAIVSYGLSFGVNSFTNSSNTFAWWHNVNGNWNCGKQSYVHLHQFSDDFFLVSNGGLILGALAILDDDTTGTASSMLNYSVPNAVANCAHGAPTYIIGILYQM
jgi:hypothetical protein